MPMSEELRCSFCGKPVEECINKKPTGEVMSVQVPGLGLVGLACWAKALICYGHLEGMNPNA